MNQSGSRLQRMSEGESRNSDFMPLSSWGSYTSIMGILNVTPDSFSDGNKFFDLQSAVSCLLPSTSVSSPPSPSTSRSFCSHVPFHFATLLLSEPLVLPSKTDPPFLTSSAHSYALVIASTVQEHDRCRRRRHRYWRPIYPTQCQVLGGRRRAREGLAADRGSEKRR